MIARLVPPWAWALAGAFILAATFASGFKVASWKCDAAKAEEMARAQRRFDKQLEQAQQAAADYERNRAQGQAESRQRETRVRETFREIQVPTECAAPDSVRGVLSEAIGSANAAASGQPSAAVQPPS